MSMKPFGRLLVLLALSAAAATSAQAQVAIDPAKLKLAQEVTEATGGQARIDEMMKLMFANIRRLTQQIAPKGSAKLAAAMQQDFEAEFSGMTPQLLVLSQEAYAKRLTTQELTDLLAWARSPSGRAIAAKSPLIQQDIMQAQMPMLKAAMPRVLRRAVDRACAIEKCSTDDRAKIDAALAKVTETSAT